MIFVITVLKMLWTHVEQSRESIDRYATNSDHCDDEYHCNGHNKSTDNAKLLSICFLPQYSTSKKAFTCDHEVSSVA